MKSDDARWYDRMEQAYGAVETDASKWPDTPDDPIPYELSALYRLETTIHSSGFLYFIGRWGEASYRMALRALTRMKALETRALLEKAHALVEPALNHPDFEEGEDLFGLLDDAVQGAVGDIDEALWDLPDDTVALGLATYGEG